MVAEDQEVVVNPTLVLEITEWKDAEIKIILEVVEVDDMEMEVIAEVSNDNFYYAKYQNM